MVLSDFRNGYTSVSLDSRYSLCSHSVHVATKKIFYIKVTLRTKIMCVTKKML